MKNLLISALGALILALLIFLISNEKHNNSSLKGDLPDIDLLLTDSTTRYRISEIKGKNPLVLLFFNTTCEHCQSFAREMLKKKEQLKGFDLVMASSESLFLIKRFRNEYSLFELKNLVIGQDVNAAGIRIFHYESYPFCSIYNSQHKFIRSFEREFTIADVISEIKKL
jgi:thiol-disulfide isomerase/thioredoxin